MLVYSVYKKAMGGSFEIQQRAVLHNDRSEELKKKDPIPALQEKLLEQHLAAEEDIQQLTNEIERYNAFTTYHNLN